ncbi:MAG: nitronate monooxygenase family protein [bacterium]|nr:nitronate monooxygenase family protein [bacterium]
MSNKLKPLILGDLEVKIPIIQGGMGIKVSTASLASAVANYGGAGTIASVALGFGTPENEKNFVKASHEGLEREIREAKKLTNGVVGINILVALSNYEELARISVKEKADFIISGAGLPMRLPEFAEGSSVKLIPIVSSARALDLIIRSWKKRYNRLPDAIVVEGPLAGGHLGFSPEDLEVHKNIKLEDLVSDVIKFVKDSDLNIPVIAAGGIYDGKDVARFIKLGVSGVQIATRFVATFECSVSEKFKQLYIDSKDSDIVIIKSPVGMPGRAIKTKLIERVMNGERIPVRCNYRCLKSCNPKTAPYCICKALGNAVLGNIDEAVVFCGSNASRINKIVSVKELMDEIVNEANEELNR